MGKERDRDEKHLTAQRGAGAISKFWRSGYGPRRTGSGNGALYAHSARRRHARADACAAAAELWRETARAESCPRTHARVAGPARLIIRRRDPSVGEPPSGRVCRDAARSRGSAAAHVGAPAGPAARHLLVLYY
jgi:hypothetical protein